MFDASTKTKERWDDDGLGGQVLLFRRAGGGILSWDSGSAKSYLLLSKHQPVLRSKKDKC